MRATFLLLFFASLCYAQEPQTTKAPAAFDPGLLDRAVDPCADFYGFVCSKWLKANPIPADQSSWGRFNELHERNLASLRRILEQAQADRPDRAAGDQKIGDYYASCMDERAIDARGLAPLRPEMERIAALQSKQDLAPEIAHLHRIGVDALFSFGSGQDAKDSTQVIAQADQGGLGLPDRDYYLSDDAKMRDLRAAYSKHVSRMMELAGDTPERAIADAKTILDIETALARASLDRVSRRDPAKVYHKMSSEQLAAASPAFSWKTYLIDVGAPPVQMLNVAAPDFFRDMSHLLASVSLDDWKTYLRWHLLHSSVSALPTPFVNESFEFYGRTLTGARELRPRWKRCVNAVDRQIGEALGKKYVELTFGAEGKARTLEMVDALERALGEDIRKLDWMTPASKDQALTKLHAIANKIGYPDKWRDYSRLRIARGDALGNLFRGEEFESDRQLAKIGKPVERDEWQMTPPTVNAYYDAQMNDINFPAGILQPPFYNKDGDEALNFGAIGAVIGHELTHGFDDEGRQFDARGNMRDWWTPADAKAFEQRAECLVRQYSKFEPVPGVHLNGKLTLGENTADNGGVRIALMALLDRLSRAGGPAKVVDGFRPEQRLFIGWAQIWCQNQTEEAARLNATVDPHSPGRARVNGVLSNMPEFREAFGCKVGQPMVSGPACRVW